MDSGRPRRVPGIARRRPVVAGAARKPADARSRAGSARTKWPPRCQSGRRPHRSLSVHCLNPRYLRIIPGTQACVQAPGNADLQGFLHPRCRRSTACHAEGRGFESLAALKKASICRSFSLRRQSPCSSASGRTDSGLAVRRSSAPFKKNARFAGRFSLVRTEVILQAGEGRVFGLLRPLPRLLLQRHDPADSACWRDPGGRGP